MQVTIYRGYVSVHANLADCEAGAVPIAEREVASFEKILYGPGPNNLGRWVMVHPLAKLEVIMDDDDDYLYSECPTAIEVVDLVRSGRGALRSVHPIERNPRPQCLKRAPRGAASSDVKGQTLMAWGS